MKVRAKTYMYYNRRGYQSGEEYEMDDRESQDAKLLATLGKIDIIDLPQKQLAPAPTYRTATTRDEEQATVQSEEPDQGAPVGPMTTDTMHVEPGKRRFYRRRDLKAER